MINTISISDSARGNSAGFTNVHGTWQFFVSSLSNFSDVLRRFEIAQLRGAVMQEKCPYQKKKLLFRM